MTGGTPSGLERTTQRQKVCQDANEHGVPDLITETVTVNARATTLMTDTLEATKTLMEAPSVSEVHSASLHRSLQ
jgi:hypothetical protein